MRAARFAVLLVAMLLAVVACSSAPPEGPTSAGTGGSGTQGSGPETTGFTEPTVSPGTGEGTAPPEATLGPSPEEPDAVLRLEGSSGTRFSGVCRVGAQDTAVRGQVPRRFEYDLGGQQLTCRIEKRGPGEGNLKVVLTAGGNTRSVQQTNVPGGTVEISYQGG